MSFYDNEKGVIGDYTDHETEEQRHDLNKECHCALLFIVDTINQCSVSSLLSNERVFPYLFSASTPLHLGGMYFVLFDMFSFAII